MADVNEYLAPGFDPASLTIPRLRSLLLQYDVDYPSSAKKGQLVDLFNDNIKPQARRILRSLAATKRSAEGIEDMASSRETSVATTDAEEESQEPIRSPPPTTRRSARYSTLDSRTEDIEQEAPPTERASRRTSTRPTRLPVVDTVEDFGTPRSPSKRSRKSIATPAIKVEDHDEMPREDHASPFSTANPFQSGSPQYSTPVISSGSNKRRTLGTIGAKSEAKSTSSRRKSDFVSSTSTSTSKLNLADAGLITRKRYPQEIEEEPEVQDEPDIGEEFTPEAQEELEVARAQTGQLETRPAKRRRSSKNTNPVLKVVPWAISIAMLTGFGTVWRQEKLQTGFCGVGRQTGELGGVKIPEWASVIQPQCEPCPPHGYCYPNMEVTCEPDFVLQPHPLALAGLVPLPPTCEADSEKARKVKTVADRAVEELRQRNAKWECGELSGPEGKRLTSPEVPEIELKASMETQKKKSMSHDEFEDLWTAAIGDILHREEVQYGAEGHTLRSTSLAHVNLTCAVRRSVRVTLERYLRQLILLILLVISGAYGRYAIVDARSTEQRAKHLATVTLERLAAQAAWARSAPGDDADSFVSVAQMRDDVLRDEFSSKRRQQLWQKVQLKVEGNSNVRSSVREGRSGEVGRAWEWIGSLGAIESPHRTPKGIDASRVEEMEESVVGRSGGLVAKQDRPIY